MKKILLQIVFFLSATIAMAQTDIQFSILKAEADRKNTICNSIFFIKSVI
jgi:hypothetical protein